MPQYGVLVYLPAPADPSELSSDYVESLEGYPAQTKELKAKVLGSSYFAAQKGFAFESSESGMSIIGDGMNAGVLSNSGLVPAAFFVLSAPDLDSAVEAAKLHPAVTIGSVEVRPLVPPPPRG